MAYIPLRAVKGAAEKIAETVIPERVIVSDPVNKITVIGDGVTKGGVPFGANEQWNKFYDGTLEELQADPEAMVAFLKDAVGNGVLFVKVEGFTNPDGTFDEEALKAWLEENYLKLTGGTLSGILTVSYSQSDKHFVAKREDVDLTTNPSTAKYAGLIAEDANAIPFGACRFIQDKYGNTQATIELYNYKEDGTTAVASILRSVLYRDGTGLFVGPTPAVDAPSTAIQTKESVTRDFLPRTGGEMYGVINSTTWGGINVSPPITYSETQEASDHVYITCCSAKTSDNIASCGVRMDTIPNAGHHFAMYAAKSGKFLGQIGLHCDFGDVDNIYAFCPHPRGQYTNDIATAKWSMDFSAIQIGAPAPNASEYIHNKIFVDPLTGSDTADINNGRGLSPERPFKNFLPALQWAAMHVVGGNNIYIELMSDVTIDVGTQQYIYIYPPLTYSLYVRGYNSQKKSLTISKPIRIDNPAYVIFSDLSIQLNSPWSFLDVSNHASVTVSNVEMNGTVTAATIACNRGGLVQLGGSITGNVTGKRFSLLNNSMIMTGGKGVNYIPGTEAGTTDATSVYA